MGVTWGRSFWIRPPFIWIEEISDSLIWTGAVGLDCIAAPPKNDVYNEARYMKKSKKIRGYFTSDRT